VNVTLISSEVHPFSRTGLLGDTVAGLASGLSQNGSDVTVMTPMYLTVCTDEDMYTQKGSVDVSAGGSDYHFDIYHASRNGVDFVFFRNDDLFGRRCIYGSGDFDYSDNDIRFGMFSLACMSYINKQSRKPDIIHCFEWSAGLVPVYRNLFFKEILSKIVFTVLDVAYQGIFNKFSLPELGLPWSVYNIEELEYYEGVSLLKGGLIHSDHVIIPSRTYMNDIKTEEHSQGLGLIFVDIASKLSSGGLGIDHSIYDPEKDSSLAKPFSSKKISGKYENKKEFLKQSELENPDLPLFLVETKFSTRKGLELITDSAQELADIPANFAFIGYGEANICTKFKEISNSHNNMYSFIGISESMAHLGYGAADFTIRPSIYEPGGKGHMAGMRYGALPILTATGAHLDDLKDIEDGGCCFFVKEFSRQELKNQITRAVDFFNNKTILDNTVIKAMERDFSWHTVSKQYADIYRRLLGGGYGS